MNQPAAFAITDRCSKASLLLLLSAALASYATDGVAYLLMILAALVMTVGLVVNLKWNVGNVEEEK